MKEHPRYREFSLGAFFWAACGNHSFCFRFFDGPGLWFGVRSRRAWVPFSERYGIATFWDVGPIRVKPLRRWRA